MEEGKQSNSFGIHEGLKELKGIFGRWDSDNRDIYRYSGPWVEDAARQDRALAILCQFPELARVELRNDWTALCLFLLATDNLSTVEAVCNLNPAAISSQCKNGMTALHFACMGEYASEKVIEFIYQKYPRAIMTLDCWGRSPPAYLFIDKKTPRARTFPKVSMLQFLLQLHPSCVKSDNDNNPCVRYGSYNSIDLLALATMIGCPADVYEAILQHYPIQAQGCQEFIFAPAPNGNEMRGRCHMGVSEVHAILQILPQIRRLNIRPQRWTGAALSRLLFKLQENKSIEEVDLALSREEFTDNQESCYLLSGIIQRNTSLRSLTINPKEAGAFRDEDGVDDKKVLYCILRGLSGNQNIVKVELKGFSFPTIWDPTEEIRVFSTLQPSHVQELVLNCGGYCMANPMFLDGLLPLLPSLKKLVSYFSFPEDAPDDGASIMTNSLIRILNSSPHLECLIVLPNGNGKPIPINAPQLFEALRRNTVLKSMDIGGCLNTPRKQAYLDSVLQNDNLTLEYIWHASFGSCNRRAGSCSKIDYVLLLNKWGRRVARNIGARKDTFVEVLNKANNQAPPNTKLTVLYGLMRERPGLWVC